MPNFQALYGSYSNVVLHTISLMFLEKHNYINGQIKRTLKALKCEKTTLGIAMFEMNNTTWLV